MKKKSRNKFYDGIQTAEPFQTRKVFRKMMSSFDQDFTNEDDDMPLDTTQRRFNPIPQ